MTSNLHINVEILPDSLWRSFLNLQNFLMIIWISSGATYHGSTEIGLMWEESPWNVISCKWGYRNCIKLPKKGTKIRCHREFSNDAIVFAVNTLRLISQSPAHTALRLQLKINGNTTMMNHESPPTATFKGYKMIKIMSLQFTPSPPVKIFQNTNCEKLVTKICSQNVDTVNWWASRRLSLSNNS